MRRLQILNIAPSNTPGIPSTITVGLDYTQIFHGKEWIDGGGTRFPYWTYDATGLLAPVPPVGTGLLIATTFEIVENPTYRGTYTVYTKVNPLDFDPSTFTGLDTVIRVMETMEVGLVDLTVGYITNISTYLFTVTGESNWLLLERQNDDDRTIELGGRQISGWGEIVLQNMLRMTQCFAGPTAPTTANTGQAPFLGQLWWNTITNTMMVKPTAADVDDWIVLNSTFIGSPGLTYRHTQGVASTTWTITHNLGVAAPFHAEASFWVDVLGQPKPILPLDVTYNSTNQLTVTFSSAETGYAIIRSAP